MQEHILNVPIVADIQITFDLFLEIFFAIAVSVMDGQAVLRIQPKNLNGLMLKVKTNNQPAGSWKGDGMDKFIGGEIKQLREALDSAEEALKNQDYSMVYAFFEGVSLRAYDAMQEISKRTNEQNKKPDA